MTEDLFHKKRPFSGPPQYLKLKRGLSCGPVIVWSVSKNAVDGSRDMVVLDYNNAESAEPYIYVSGGSGGRGVYNCMCPSYQPRDRRRRTLNAHRLYRKHVTMEDAREHVSVLWIIDSR